MASVTAILAGRGSGQASGQASPPRRLTPQEIAELKSPPPRIEQPRAVVVVMGARGARWASGLDRLYAEGVLEPRHIDAAQRYVELQATPSKALRDLRKAICAGVGARGLTVLDAVCNGTTAAKVAFQAGFTRGEDGKLGDARKAYLAIRMAFDGLDDALTVKVARTKVR